MASGWQLELASPLRVPEPTANATSGRLGRSGCTAAVMRGLCTRPPGPSRSLAACCWCCSTTPGGAAGDQQAGSSRIEGCCIRGGRAWGYHQSAAWKQKLHLANSMDGASVVAPPCAHVHLAGAGKCCWDNCKYFGYIRLDIPAFNSQSTSSRPTKAFVTPKEHTPLWDGGGRPARQPPCRVAVGWAPGRGGVPPLCRPVDGSLAPFLNLP